MRYLFIVFVLRGPTKYIFTFLEQCVCMCVVWYMCRMAIFFWPTALSVFARRHLQRIVAFQSSVER